MLYHVTTLHGLLCRPLGNDAGASSVEYSLLAVLIAAVILGVVGAVGLDVFRIFDDVQQRFP